MKKIVIFINSLSLGGAQRQACTLASGLAEKGYDVILTTFGEASDIYTCSPKVHRKHIAPRKGKVMKLFAIWHYFLTVKTDWVIGFGQRECNLCLKPLIFRSRNRIRVIAGDRNTTFGKPDRIERELMMYLYKRVDYIVPNSYAQREYIIKSNNDYTNKTITITNYTDIEKFQPTPLPEGRILRIGIFSRYSYQKNCMRFVEVIRLLKEKSSCKFVVDWYGNRYLKDTLSNPVYDSMKFKVEEYELNDYININDITSDVVGEMSKFDACCLPSLYEGFSNSISEAICCGKPCLVSDVADNGIMVKDGVNGFLFDPTNEESIVSAFLKFLNLSPKERQQMGNASRERAEVLFNLDEFLQKYVDLIES